MEANATTITENAETELERPHTSQHAVELPWRTFKAFLQLFDLDTGAVRISPDRLLVFSQTRAGEKIRQELLSHRLIIWSDEMNRHVLLRGLPMGRDPVPEVPANPFVMPVNRSLKGVAWRLTEGRCAYCGTHLSFFNYFAIFPSMALSTVTENLPPLFACKPCHSTRGSRSLDEMRLMLGMRTFEHLHGIRFSQRQVEFLESQGCKLDIPRPSFWFEKAGIADQEENQEEGDRG